MDTGTAAMMGGAAGLMTGVLLAEATQPHYGYGGGWYGPPCGPTIIENTTIIDNTNVMVNDYPDAAFVAVDGGWDDSYTAW
jgi:hypothetical protein